MNPVKDLFFNSSIRRVRDQEFLPNFLINATYGLYLDPYAISFLAKTATGRATKIRAN